MLVLLPLLLALGLFLPGYFAARLFGYKFWAPSAFILSLPILFHCVFWLEVAGIPIKLWTVAPLLIVTTGALAWAHRRVAPTSRESKKIPWTSEERVLLLAIAAVGVILLVHSAQAPLVGQDTWFRWDFLAQQITRFGNFRFYPPQHPADFRSYFYVDGIPPLVSFTHWWLYASAGKYLPVLICLRVAVEFACTLAFTYGTASALFSRRAGVLAAAALAASPLYFRAVFLGQETGLTALAVAAMLYFIVAARQPVPAALAAAVCALSREYGWIALVGGVIALAWRRESRKQILMFGGVAVAVAAPWYVRNWIVAGNPMYSLRLAGFAVNPVHDALLQFYKSRLGIQTWTAFYWLRVLGLLLWLAVPQILAGVPGAFLQLRKHGYLLAMAVLMTGVWLASVGYTSGGVDISLRVLSPALVVLSITAAGALERWRSMVVPIGIGACLFWTAAQGILFPFDPISLGPSQWAEKAFAGIDPPIEFKLRDQMIGFMPHGARILSDNAYLHAALYDAGIEVVPVWSPEVRFIFSAPPEEAERRLAEMHIATIAISPQSQNAKYLASASPLYAALPERWNVLAESTGSLYILVPKNR